MLWHAERWRSFHLYTAACCSGVQHYINTVGSGYIKLSRCACSCHRLFDDMPQQTCFSDCTLQEGVAAVAGHLIAESQQNLQCWSEKWSTSDPHARKHMCFRLEKKDCKFACWDHGGTLNRGVCLQSCSALGMPRANLCLVMSTADHLNQKIHKWQLEHCQLTAQDPSAPAPHRSLEQLTPHLSQQQQQQLRGHHHHHQQQPQQAACSAAAGVGTHVSTSNIPSERASDSSSTPSDASGSLTPRSRARKVLAQVQMHVAKTGFWSTAGALGRGCVPATAAAGSKAARPNEGPAQNETRGPAAAGHCLERRSAGLSTGSATAAAGAGGTGCASLLRGVKPPQLTLDPASAAGVHAVAAVGGASSSSRYKGTGETIFRSSVKAPGEGQKEVRGQAGGVTMAVRTATGAAAPADELGYGSTLSSVLDMEDLKRDLEQSLKGRKQQLRKP